MQPKPDDPTHAPSPHDAIEAKLERAMNRHGHSGYGNDATQHKKFLGDLLNMLKQHEVRYIEESFNNFSLNLEPITLLTLA